MAPIGGPRGSLGAGKFCQTAVFVLWLKIMSPQSPEPRSPGPGRPRSFSRRAVWLLVGGLTVGVILLTLWRPQITEFIELKLVDLKFLFRGPVPAGQELAIVAIDDDSLKSYGRWPWSRQVFSQLMERLKAAQPKVIGLDIIFAEKSETAMTALVQRLRQKLSHRGLGSREMLAFLQEEEKAADADRRLAEEIGQGAPTILGFYFKKVGAKVISAEPPRALEPTVI